MKTRFYIEKRKDESGKLLVDERPVFMSVSFSGNRVILGTGIKVNLHGWNSEVQRVKSTYPDSYVYNGWFETLIDTATSTLNTLQSSQEVSNSEQFQKLFNELKPIYSTGFFDVFYMFMESNSSKWSASTYRKVRTLYKHLRELETNTGNLISFNKMNASFLHQFNVYYSDKGNSETTTYKAINNLVWFLNWATDNGYNVYREYRSFYKLMGTVIKKSRNQLFLQWVELLKIRNFIPDNRRMERVRDAFCFMCFTGVRFAELKGLKKDDISDEEIIIRKKSGKLRRLSLNKFAREIYQVYENKYYMNNTAFPTMSIITMNKYLRQIGEEAGMDREVVLAEGDDVKVPLYERLTAGIAVNTFIANALELGIPLEVISSFTGVQNDSRVRRIKMDLAKEEMKKFDQR